MAVGLPHFEPFLVYQDENTVGVRWRKWVDKLEILLSALDISSDARKKALLLHYAGDEVYTIVESFTDEQKGKGHTRTEGDGDEQRIVADEYGKLKETLTSHFTPKKNVSYEVLKFRAAKQNAGESLDSFHTRLRTLATFCEFQNIDNEILTQILQGCSSNRLRRRALRENYTLEQILSSARAQELSEARATEIESNQTASANVVRHGGEDRGRRRMRNSGGQRQRGGHSQDNQRGGHSQDNQRGGHFQDKSSKHGRGGYRRHGRGGHHRNQSTMECRNCGGQFPHDSTGCPAAGKTCLSCSKVGHFARKCRSNKVSQISHTDTDAKPLNDIDSSSDESIFHVSGTSKIPSIRAHMLNTDINFLVDTGATVNIIHSDTYKSTNPKAKLHNPCPTIHAYGSNKPLPVCGYISADITFKTKTVQAKFFVVESESTTPNLLSYETAQALGVIQFAFVCGGSIPDEYPSLFDGKLGKIKDVQVHLHVDKEVKPVVQQHRRIPFHLRHQVEAELAKLEEQDIIEKVSGAGPTPWVSPIVCVPKKQQGEVRICVDMREANKAIGREKHPMPTLDDLIADLNGATVFSKLDLTQAYHQLELDESSRYITTFSTHVGLHRYKRLLFGVNAASEIFQNTISTLLHDIPGVKNLSDDIVIFGKDQKEHDKSLRATLKRLEETGAKLNRKKCVFSTDSITFYGHVFGKNGVSADPEKIKAIVDAEAPTNVAELRSFLGMAQYMSRFIQGYASLTAPLRALLKKGTQWTWTTTHQTAFEKLKEALTSSSAMAYFDPKKKSTILVDASPVGLGAILTQEGKAVCYASRALTPVEQRYSQTDREMLAVVYGVEHFHLYVQGDSFQVVTDHKPLLGIMKSRNPTTARIERWRLRLMPYEFDLTYRPGRNEQNPADFISRHPQSKPQRDNVGEEYISFLTRTAVPKSMTQDEVREATQQDRQLQQVMIAIQTGKWDSLPEYARFRDELSVHDGLVLRGHRLVIPTSLQQRVIDIAHQSHQGIVKTKQLLREKVWFPNIDKMVEATVKSCVPCQASYQGPPQREPIQATPLPPGPWSHVAVDFAGPFPSGTYLMIVTDEYSRYPEVSFLTSTSEQAVLPKLDEIFARQGFPEVVKTDNGPPFNGKAFASFAKQYGFKHRKITPLWPEANGAAERVVQTIKKTVRSFVTEGLDWKKELTSFLRTYRATPHTATGVSPFEALTGRKMNMGIPSVPKPPVRVPLHTRIQHNDAVSKKKMVEYANARRHTTPSNLETGDIVLVKQTKQNTLTTPYNPTPLTVKEKKGSMVTAERPDGSSITRNSSYFKQLPRSFRSLPETLPENNDDDVPSLHGADSAEDVSPDVPSIPVEAPPPVLTEVRRSGRIKQTPSYLKDYVTK